MRQVEMAVVNAVERGRRLMTGNTHVVHGDQERVGGSRLPAGFRVYLHGNLIAMSIGSEVFFTFAGWVTATTASRLRALTAALEQPVSVARSNGSGMVGTKDATYDFVHVGKMRQQHTGGAR